MKKETKQVWEEIIEGYYYTTNTSWLFQIGSQKPKQFGLFAEIIDIDESGCDQPNPEYPFAVEICIVADKVHKSFDDSGKAKPTKLDLIFDCVQYMGGVPVGHFLDHCVNGKFGALTRLFSGREATVFTQDLTYGTVAAQGMGKGHTYLCFATRAAAKKYLDFILEDRAGALGMIGFILDRPVNMVGEDGWSVLKQQVSGKK